MPGVWEMRIRLDSWPWQQPPRRGIFGGRFGGGWNWKLGLQAGGRTLIIYLLWGAIIIDREKKP